MRWIRRNLRGNAVYVRLGDSGEVAAGPDGRVDVIYRLLPGAKVYRASIRNLEPTGDPADERPVEADVGEPQAAGGTRRAPAEPPADAIIIYTDGACHGNPGPAGVGVVILEGDERREISEYLGEGTNNIAELTAIERALEAIPPDARGRTILLHTDSAYSIGLLQSGWKAKANVELVKRLRRLAAGFADLRLVKVRGHAGIPENERADELANQAIYDAR
jgi:ribonuclease HI